MLPRRQGIDTVTCLEALTSMEVGAMPPVEPVALKSRRLGRHGFDLGRGDEPRGGGPHREGKRPQSRGQGGGRVDVRKGIGARTSGAVANLALTLTRLPVHPDQNSCSREIGRAWGTRSDDRPDVAARPSP